MAQEKPPQETESLRDQRNEVRALIGLQKGLRSRFGPGGSTEQWVALNEINEQLMEASVKLMQADPPAGTNPEGK